ncbi:MAG TPA: nitrate/sulfonate/bicarbonate ABC transporter ATP-binding protein [Vicinamibacteria bacterium]|nr:nitrate/sulfonate/bicarbonate ABC transporter ATP-binding protein [Vicinamibacteria bacterium]
MAEAAICELKGVQQSFDRGDGRALRVLEDITLEVRPNEVLCLLGPSGCGKSTILRIVAGLIRPTAGEVRYHGEPLEGLNPGMAMVFQSFALLPWMTVEQNVTVVLRSLGLDEAAVREQARRAIRMVGLDGFRGAYPRELSGGMKQRVGMARALSVDPEVLLMDEPFSQVDALTAEGLRAEVLDLWDDRERKLSSIVMVSHDIAEVAYMADRIAILSANPGRIRTVLDNTLGRPRNTRSPDFLWLLDHLHDIVTSAELPDVAVTTAAPSVVSRDLVEPIPSAQMAEILGLLEYLASQGGPCDLFQMAHETHGTFVEVLATVKGAEMLGMLDTPQRLVILTPLGRRFVAAGMEERKQIWGTQLQRLALFRVVRELLDLSGGELGREDVIAEIHQRLPREDAERIFETVVLWGRFGGLFNYLEEGGVLSLA